MVTRCSVGDRGHKGGARGLEALDAVSERGVLIGRLLGVGEQAQFSALAEHQAHRWHAMMTSLEPLPCHSAPHL